MTGQPPRIDCHTHVWEEGVHLGGSFVADLRRAWGDQARVGITLAEHWAAMAAVDRAIVLAFDAPAVGAVVPNEYVADYVGSHPDKLIGFASVDPNDSYAHQRLVVAVRDLGLRGLKVAPIYQDFDPLGDRAGRLFATADELGIPVLWHQGTSFVRMGPLKYSNPIAVDEVARAFPNLPIVVAHLGHPWIAETIVTVRKHQHVFADISALHPRPWQFYNALVLAIEYGVADKLLMGSDYPFFTAQETWAALKRLPGFDSGTPLPHVPDDVIDGIIRKNSVELLGLD